MSKTNKTSISNDPSEDFEIHIFKGLIKFTCKRVTVKAIIALVIVLLFVFAIVKL